MMIRQGGLYLSKKDLQVFRVIEENRAGRISLWDASQKLGLSYRSASRKLRRVREKGLDGLVHGNRGRTPTNKTTDQIRTWYVELFRERYYDFNFKHAYEFIVERHELPQRICYDTFRKWLRAEGLGQSRKRRPSKARKLRERHAEEGYMVQLDGSPDRYNGNDEWTLVNIIDDATSKLLQSEFQPSETTFGCMRLMRKLIEENGAPEFVLTDRAGWSARFGKRAHFSQFERACNELGITVISTSSAPSKGRVERSFRTSQGRLRPELRLNEIKSMPLANRYLEHVFKPDWNKRFAVEARAKTSRYRAVPKHLDLNEIFCLKHPRLINRDHTVHFDGVKYKLTNPTHNMWKHEVTVHQYESGEIGIFYGAMKLEFEKVDPLRSIWRKSA
jgi:transposase-like protein